MIVWVFIHAAVAGLIALPIVAVTFSALSIFMEANWIQTYPIASQIVAGLCGLAAGAIGVTFSTLILEQIQ